MLWLRTRNVFCLFPTYMEYTMFISCYLCYTPLPLNPSSFQTSPLVAALVKKRTPINGSSGGRDLVGTSSIHDRVLKNRSCAGVYSFCVFTNAMAIPCQAWMPALYAIPLLLSLLYPTSEMLLRPLGVV